MDENRFVVDLGKLKLSDAQRLKINTAIHRAVTMELSAIDPNFSRVLIPVAKLPNFKRPFIYGIIIRNLTRELFDKVQGRG